MNSWVGGLTDEVHQGENKMTSKRHIKRKLGRNIIVFSTLLLLCFSMISPAVVRGEEITVVIDLGAINNRWSTISRAYSINNAGLVVGYSHLDGSTRDYHAFLWASDTGMIDLGTLGGTIEQSMANDINDFGQVVGGTRDSTDHSVAFLWAFDTGMTQLGSLGGIVDTAYAINNAGQAVGVSKTSWYGPNHATLWDTNTGTITDLGSPGTSSLAYDINDMGQVVGVIEGHATLWDTNTGTITDLGTFGGMSTAKGINNLGQVVGFSYNPTSQKNQAFIWTSDTGMIDLGPLDSGVNYCYAEDINDAGQVVGYMTYYSGPSRATIWDTNTGTITDIGTISGGLAAYGLAYGINNAGRVVGISTSLESGGVAHATLWGTEADLPSTPPDQTEDIQDILNSYIETNELTESHAVSLIIKLDKVIDLLDTSGYNAQTEKQVITLLNALINQVNAFVNADIFTLEQGNNLIDDINGLIETINNS